MKRLTSLIQKLAWVSLGFFLFLYLSVSYNPDHHKVSTTNNQVLQSVMEACRTLKQEIEYSQFPYAENQYSRSYLFKPPKNEMLRINKKHKISICVPYKAGSETWRYLMDSLNNSTNTLDHIEAWVYILPENHYFFI